MSIKTHRDTSTEFHTNNTTGNENYLGGYVDPAYVASPAYAEQVRVENAARETAQARKYARYVANCIAQGQRYNTRSIFDSIYPPSRFV